ncbi:MAG: integron integrase [Gemmatimonadota bacterium]|jgi:integron integrase
MPDTHPIDRLLRSTREQLRRRSYSPRTVDTYARWIRRFLRANPNHALERLGRKDVERFLTHLAHHHRLAPKSRNQASSALAFFFREVLGRDELRHIARAKEPKRIPSVLSHRQVMLVLGELQGKHRLLASLMYGAGLRLTEAHRLRVKDIDFDLMQITVRDGKGAKDRWVMLPDRLVRALHRQVDAVRTLHAEDRRRGAGWAPLPHALARKEPRAGYEIDWQFVFPASRWSADSATDRLGRNHLHPTSVQRAVKKAGKACRIPKPVTCHTLRRTFATQMLRAGYDVRTVQRIMGHKDVRTTMLYIEAITDTGIGMRSPLDQPNRRD